MKILLDTHILLWTITNDFKLSQQARKLIENPANEIYYSIISVWEVQLKHLVHPEAMPVDGAIFANYCKASGFLSLPVREQHIFSLSKLKRDATAPPHKDPFDKLLICQALEENMLFITHDSLLTGYGLPCIIQL